MTIDLNDAALVCEYRVCKNCGEEKKRFKKGLYPNGKDYKYVDGMGKEWSGRLCPTCHYKNNALRQKKKRARKKLYV